MTLEQAQKLYAEWLAENKGRLAEHGFVTVEEPVGETQLDLKQLAVFTSPFAVCALRPGGVATYFSKERYDYGYVAFDNQFSAKHFERKGYTCVGVRPEPGESTHWVFIKEKEVTK